MLIPSMCYPMYRQYNESFGIQNIPYKIKTDYSRNIHGTVIDHTAIKNILGNGGNSQAMCRI